MNEIQNTFCVIGDPIGHSLSPLIHTFVFKELHLPYAYETCHVPKEKLNEFVIESRKNQRPGFNVTIPHKQNIIPFLDALDPLAQKVGAVNTVDCKQGKWTGYNTDMEGFRTALARTGWSPKKGTVVLLGAGGAARAVIYALKTFEIHEVFLFEIDFPKANEFCSEFESELKISIKMGSSLPKALENAELLVNASPVGMWPHVTETPIPDPNWIPSTCTVFDLVPNPVETRLLKEAKAKGAKVIPGLSMLILQALSADEIWLNQKIPETLYDPIFQHCINQLEKYATHSDSHRG